MLILDRNARPTVALTEEPTSRPSISPTNKPTVIPSARSLAPSAGGSSNSTSAEVTLHRSIDRPSDISSLNSTNYPKSVSQRLLDETVDDPQLDRHERFNHGTQTQDDSLTSQMIEDAQQADNADAAAALNNQLKQGDDVMPLESVSEGEVAAYYGTVMACMEGGDLLSRHRVCALTLSPFRIPAGGLHKCAQVVHLGDHRIRARRWRPLLSHPAPLSVHIRV